MNNDQFQELLDRQKDLIDKVSETNRILMKMIEYHIYAMDIDTEKWVEIAHDFRKLCKDIGHSPDAGLIDKY